jgi:hypothetical protein
MASAPESNFTGPELKNWLLRKSRNEKNETVVGNNLAGVHIAHFVVMLRHFGDG